MHWFFNWPQHASHEGWHASHSPSSEKIHTNKEILHNTVIPMYNNKITTNIIFLLENACLFIFVFLDYSSWWLTGEVGFLRTRLLFCFTLAVHHYQAFIASDTLVLLWSSAGPAACRALLTLLSILITVEPVWALEHTLSVWRKWQRPNKVVVSFCYNFSSLPWTEQRSYVKEAPVVQMVTFKLD